MNPFCLHLHCNLLHRSLAWVCSVPSLMVISWREMLLGGKRRQLVKRMDCSGYVPYTLIMMDNVWIWMFYGSLHEKYSSSYMKDSCLMCLLLFPLFRKFLPMIIIRPINEHHKVTWSFTSRYNLIFTWFHSTPDMHNEGAWKALKMLTTIQL